MNSGRHSAPWLAYGLSLLLFFRAICPSAHGSTTCLPPTNGESSGESFIVTLRSGVNQEALIAQLKLKPHHQFKKALNGFAVNLTPRMAVSLRKDSRVEAVEIDGGLRAFGTNIPAGVQRMNIPAFPVAHIDGGDHRINVDVAVMDTGIQTNHPDLNVVHWADFTGSGDNGDDRIGHGTHVAGIIGALDNGNGVVGVAPGARLWSVQVLSNVYKGSWSQFLAGCDYISSNANQISIVNASLGGPATGGVPYTAIHNAIFNLVSQGIVFIAAAGNMGVDIMGNSSNGVSPTNIPNFIIPAALPEVMAVSAMDPSRDWIWDNSNYSSNSKSPCYVQSPGMAIDVCAPGVNIFSTYTNSGYTNMTGTSAAAAHVTGLVALYIAANGRAHNLQDVMKIRQAIIDNSLPQSQWNPLCDDGDCSTRDPDGFPEPLAFPSENWVPSPFITSYTLANAMFTINFQAVPGYTYQVQTSGTSGQAGPWNSFGNILGEGSVTNGAVWYPAYNSNHFFRLRRSPTP